MPRTTATVALRAALHVVPTGVTRRTVCVSAEPTVSGPAEVRILVVDDLPKGDTRTSEFAVDRMALDTDGQLADIIKFAAAAHNGAAARRTNGD